MEAKKVEIKAKILGLSATPVKDGNCDTMVKEALKAAKQCGDDLGGGIETEFVTLANREIAMCKHCQWCIENRAPCQIQDDAQKVFEKVRECDGLIIGTPAWTGTICPMYATLSSRWRYYFFFTQEFRNKVVAYLTLGFFGFGLEHALDEMYHMTRPFMLPVATVGVIASTVAYGQRPAYLEHGVLDNKAGMDTVKKAAIRVVEITRMIKYAKQAGIVLPEDHTYNLLTGGKMIGREEKVFKEGVWREK